MKQKSIIKITHKAIQQVTIALNQDTPIFNVAIAGY